ncbi:MBL fold metallo-hydrolase [Psychrobacter sp. YP14]|uniref:MBL fold metallo-hydrolase n=2 Tax=Psychrobacter TaxID=497 RepID=A0A844LZB3_9GAMM|nr:MULTISPECIES: MBL fold metallo-hydrolase [Psychrobacter]AWT48170.1 MBL fold metallo-hydrolase [Psychrobacter sp. YP14]MUG31708.1 MBL fold metallo-hydrolase [Psychrobacter sanguinis]
MSFLKKSMLALAGLTLSLAATAASDTGVAVDKSKIGARPVLPDFTVGMCDDAAPTLVHLKDNLYRHTNGKGLAVHSGIVMITDEGALVVDAGATCAAEWLNKEINERFKVPVKYVVVTHAHADHMAGTDVFQRAGATVVANQRALEPIIGEKLPYAVPDKVFDKDMSITLGGEKVELHHVAPSHSDSMTMVLFPRQKALQCTDVCQHKTMPYNDFLDFYYPGWIDTLDWVVAQDVDIIDIGHYTPATKADQVALRNYMVDLHQQVLDLTRRGQTWDQLYRNVKFSPEVQEWTNFSNMKTLNVLGMHRWVTNHRRGMW